MTILLCTIHKYLYNELYEFVDVLVENDTTNSRGGVIHEVVPLRQQHCYVCQA